MDPETKAKAEILDALVILAQKFPGQPVSLIEDKGVVLVGVLDLYCPTDENWFFKPVPLERLANVKVEQAA